MMGWQILHYLSKHRCRLSRVTWCSLRYLSTNITRKLFCAKHSTEHITKYEKTSPPWNVMFFGTDEFALKSLELLHGEQQKGGLIERVDVVSVPRKRPITAVSLYCKKNDIDVIDWPVVVPQGVYDVGIVASFGHLIPASVINAFPMGIINVHGSLLPRWRGAAPIIHALLNQDQKTGITLMRIAPHRFDVGQVVSKVVVPVEWNIKRKELTAHLATVGAQELLSIFSSLPQHLNKARPQSSDGITKAPKVTEATSRICWSEWSCRSVQAHFRALDDHVPLWTLWQGTPVKLRAMVMHPEWSSSIVDAETLRGYLLVGRTRNMRECTSTGRNFKSDNIGNNDYEVEDSTESDPCDSADVINLKTNEMEVPGTLLYDKKEKLIKVRCKDGWVAFQRVMIKGRKPMAAHDFYNGFMSKVTKDICKFT